MKVFKGSHTNPVAIVVVFLIVGILGVAPIDLPVRLTPNLKRPRIKILNFRRSATPATMECELLEPQEEVLVTIVGLESFSSSVRAGMSITTLSFQMGTDMPMKLLDVINAMNQSPGRHPSAAKESDSLRVGQVDFAYKPDPWLVLSGDSGDNEN